MARGPGGDRFRAEWLVVPLRALLVGKTAACRSSRVGIAVDDRLLQVRVTRSAIEVSPHDGSDLEGDAVAVRGIFNTRHDDLGGSLPDDRLPRHAR